MNLSNILENNLITTLSDIAQNVFACIRKVSLKFCLKNRNPEMQSWPDMKQKLMLLVKVALHITLPKKKNELLRYSF